MVFNRGGFKGPWLVRRIIPQKIGPALTPIHSETAPEQENARQPDTTLILNLHTLLQRKSVTPVTLDESGPR